MAKYFFCIFCGNSVGIKSIRCSKCRKNLEEVLELASLLETSTLTNREVVEKRVSLRLRKYRKSIIYLMGKIMTLKEN